MVAEGAAAEGQGAADGDLGMVATVRVQALVVRHRRYGQTCAMWICNVYTCTGDDIYVFLYFGTAICCVTYYIYGQYQNFEFLKISSNIATGTKVLS
jgi:hypothetical protein